MLAATWSRHPYILESGTDAHTPTRRWERGPMLPGAGARGESHCSLCLLSGFVCWSPSVPGCYSLPWKQVKCWCKVRSLRRANFIFTDKNENQNFSESCFSFSQMLFPHLRHPHSSFPHFPQASPQFSRCQSPLSTSNHMIFLLHSRPAIFCPSSGNLVLQGTQVP